MNILRVYISIRFRILTLRLLISVRVACQNLTQKYFIPHHDDDIDILQHRYVPVPIPFGPLCVVPYGSRCIAHWLCR